MKKINKYNVLIIIFTLLFIFIFMNQHFFFYFDIYDSENDFIIEINPIQYSFNQKIKQFILIEENSFPYNIYELEINLNNSFEMQKIKIKNNFNVSDFNIIMIKNNIIYKFQNLYKYKHQKVFLSDENWEYF